MSKIYQHIGSDAEYILPIITLNDAPLDLSGFSVIEVYLQYNGNSAILKKYSTAESSLEVYDATNGLLKVNVKRDDIEDFKRDKDVYHTVKTYKTNTDFEDNKKQIETDLVYFFTVVKTAGYGN